LHMAEVSAIGVRSDVRIVHISDTHNRHDQVTEDLLELEADILIHTGDFSDTGEANEFSNFNTWMGKVKDKFPLGIYLVLGNHDYKFLNGLSPSEDLAAVMASDEERRKYFQDILSNVVVLDNEVRTIVVGEEGEMSLTIYGAPWNPWQSSPTYPDRVYDKVKSDHDRVFEMWRSCLPEERKNKWEEGEAWRYDEIPTDGGVDILLTHVPPFGVFDQQPWPFTNWGSSQPLTRALMDVKPRMHLFGHVHAQRGYWEKVDARCETEITSILGGVQYATTTHEEVKNELMEGSVDFGIQFMANTALMSDRTVQPFGKKKIVGKPRLIYGTWIPQANGTGQWNFHGTGGGAKY